MPSEAGLAFTPLLSFPCGPIPYPSLISNATLPLPHLPLPNTIPLPSPKYQWSMQSLLLNKACTSYCKIGLLKTRYQYPLLIWYIVGTPLPSFHTTHTIPRVVVFFSSLVCGITVFHLQTYNNAKYVPTYNLCPARSRSSYRLCLIHTMCWCPTKPALHLPWYYPFHVGPIP